MTHSADTPNIKCQQESHGRSGSSNRRLSRWTWRSSLTLQVPRDTWAVIPAEAASPPVPMWLFTNAATRICCRDSPQARQHAVIPLIKSIWRLCVTVPHLQTCRRESVSKTPAVNQTQRGDTLHWGKAFPNFKWHSSEASRLSAKNARIVHRNLFDPCKDLKHHF